MKRPEIVKRGRGVQPETIDMVAKQISSAMNATTNEFEIKHIALSSINLWDEQPRTFHVTYNEVIKGAVDQDSDNVAKKEEELEGIIGLALSIDQLGMLNCPIAYALPGGNVQVLAGQRRMMAASFAALYISEGEINCSSNPDLSTLDRVKIKIKVYGKRPDSVLIEQIGIADNTQRVDLPVSDVLSWLIRYAEYKSHANLKLSWQEVVSNLNVSRARAFHWLKIINEMDSEWVKRCCRKVIDENAPIKYLMTIAAAENVEREALYKAYFEKSLAVDSKISITKKLSTSSVRSLILANASQELKADLSHVDWNNSRSVKKAFSLFIDDWENIHGK